MSWSRVAICFVAAFAGLAGCGYAPATVSDTGPLNGAIRVDDPVDPQGFALVQQLERRLGLADDPDYRLSAEIRTRDEGIGFTPDEAITRYNIEGRVRYVIDDVVTGETVTTGQVQNFTSYSATSTQFATQTARRDAQERLMVSLADQITAELILTAPDWQK